MKIELEENKDLKCYGPLENTHRMMTYLSRFSPIPIASTHKDLNYQKVWLI